MRQSPGLLIGAASAVLLAVGFAGALEASRQLTTLGMAATGPAAPAVAPIIPNEVNRVLKGDRQRVIVLPEGAEPFGVQVPPPPSVNPKPQLPDGCETALSRTSPTPAGPPARCVT